ncbi:hypothetical protein [Nannocystis pusilla]|uniref:hypothetical protein n=1 Tax=Nannocystis pusilla TaxID=889268 RepID=UPI003B7DCDB5
MKLPFSPEPSPPGAVIGDSRVQAVLKRLHGAAAGQRLQIVRRFVPALLRGPLLRRRPSAEEMSEIAKDLYLPLSPEQGRCATWSRERSAPAGSSSSARRSGSPRSTSPRRCATTAAGS